jgi:hypothetical protein
VSKDSKKQNMNGSAGQGQADSNRLRSEAAQPVANRSENYVESSLKQKLAVLDY